MATAPVVEPRPAGALTPEPFRVLTREQETGDTWTLELEPVAGPAPSIAPGQFVMAYAFGIGEVPISVSGPPFRRISRFRHLMRGLSALLKASRRRRRGTCGWRR